MRLRWFVLGILSLGLLGLWWLGSSISSLSSPKANPGPDRSAAIDAVASMLVPGAQLPQPAQGGPNPNDLTVEQRNARWLSLRGDLAIAGPNDKGPIVEKIRALAESGDARAQMFMGGLYVNGAQGLPQDHAEAERWFALAGQPRKFVESGTPTIPLAPPDNSLPSGATPVPAQAAPTPTPGAGMRLPPIYQAEYHGDRPELFAQYKDRVRLLLQQAQIEISSQLGLLQYQAGFQCPLIVSFSDKPPPGVEYALAYVRILPIDGRFAQSMVVNLSVMASYPQEDFDKVFYHEMTHAVLNDAVLSVSQKPLPSWVQEGLAVYIDGDGEFRVNARASRVSKSQVDRIVRDLNDPVLDYARDYLAFKYMVDKQSINTLQTFVRDLAQGMDPEQAVEESAGMPWDDFRKKVKEYTADTYREYARM